MISLAGEEKEKKNLWWLYAQEQATKRLKKQPGIGLLSADVMQVASWFIVLSPKNALSNSAGACFWVLGGVRDWSHCLSHSIRVSRYYQCVQSSLHLVNRREQHDPAALPTAPNDFQNISWISRSLNAAVMQQLLCLRTSESLPYWMTYSSS